MLSLRDFEKLVDGPDNKTQLTNVNITQINVFPIKKQNPINKFFSTYRNRYLIFSILSYLKAEEILKACYLNKMLYSHLKKKLEKHVIILILF